MKIKDATGYRYEQYNSEAEVCKRMNQLRENGINVEDDVQVTNYR